MSCASTLGWCAQDYQRLLASQPTRRLNTAKLAESSALRTKLVDTISFMESLAVKDSNEKDSFFKRLPTVLPTLPLPVVQRKVCKSIVVMISWERCAADDTSLLPTKDGVAC